MTISRLGLDRAIARIIHTLETIREEGYDRDGNPTWYALDRLPSSSPRNGSERIGDAGTARRIAGASGAADLTISDR